MNLLIRVWTPALVMVFILSACSLDIEDTDSLITDETSVFDGVADVDGQIDNMYNSVRGQTEPQDFLYALTEVSTDELLVPTRGTDWGDNGVWRTLHAHTWGPTHQYVLGVWNDKNSAVLRATEVIDPSSNATASQVADAKFLRAYNMWLVMDMYGQVPFRNPTDGVDVDPSVYTRAEAYELVVQDLRDAITGLPASDPSSADKSRAVKATAQFFLAKVLLNGFIYSGESSPSAADMNEVADLVDAIEADGYAVNGDYFETFRGSNQSNSDVIWSVAASTGNRMWNGLHYNQQHPDNTGGGWNGFTTLAEFYDLFESNGQDALTPETPNPAGGAQELRRGFTDTEATTDATNYGFGYGFQVGQMYGWNGSEAVELTDRVGNPLSFTKELPALVGNNERTGIRVLKYSPRNGGFASGVVMARFADAHLMKAEAILRGGDGNGETALDLVNELRTARGASMLGSVSLDDLIDERGRELYTEGWRRNDMVRFGTYTSDWSFKDGNAVGDETKNLFPIPASALLTNPNLVQNPGY